MAFTGNLAWYVSTNKYSAVTAWATGVAKNVGDIVKQSGTPTAGNERCYVLIAPSGGVTTGASDPLTTFTRGVILTDNTTGKWQEITGVAALNGDMTNTPTWLTVKNTAVTLGHVIQSNDGTKILICSVAGTAGNGAEPSWSTTLGGTTADNSATWVTLKISSNHFANWAAPHKSVRNATATNWADQVGQTLFVGNSHAQAEAANVDPFQSRGSAVAPAIMICVSESGSVPPVSADITTGAVEETTAGTISVNGFVSAYGITWRASGSPGNIAFMRNSNNGDKYFENCRMEMLASVGGTATLFGSFSGNQNIRCKDCTFKFSNAGHGINCWGFLELVGCTVDAGGTAPTQLFISPSSNGQVVSVRNCDLSAITNTLVKFNASSGVKYFFENCKVNASLTTYADISSLNTGCGEALFVNCEGDGSNYKHRLFKFGGTETVDTGVYRHLGAQNPDLQHYSWKIVTTANCGFGASNFDTSKISGWNTTTGHDVAVTLYGIINAAAMPTIKDVWLAIDYLGSSGSPIASRAISGSHKFLDTTALTADTSDWDDGATARVNGHVYSVGDVISLATNPGRLFFCTTGGTSAGSEPGGYATAVDGGSVTDNTAVFRAGWRVKLTALCTSPSPAQTGIMNGKVFVSKPSITLYIDPLLDIEQSSS